MILLIDAYNVLKQKDGAHYISPEDQEAFINQLASYASKKKHTIIVVFDGGSSWRPEEFVEGPVKVVYAGYNANADMIIKERLPLLDPIHTLLVTSDRALRDYASRYDILSIESSIFKHYYSRVNHVPSRLPIIVKDHAKPLKQRGHESSSEVDELMEKASRVILYKSEDMYVENAQQEVHSKQRSKHEKRIAQVLKKL